MTKRRSQGKAWRLVPALSAFGILLASFGLAEPILHEYFEFDGASGGSEAAHGGSGLSAGATPPNTRTPRNSATPERSSDATAGNPDPQRGDSKDDDAYRLDSNTTRPDQVGYEDPFTPSIPPFKRLYAYDSVDARFELVVADASLVPLKEGGQALGQEYDQFYGDIELSADARVPERFPSVGPGAVILAARLEPRSGFELQRDGADNWFITRPEGGPTRLLVHLAIDRAAFGSPFRDPEWRDLNGLSVALPPNVKQRGLDVADQLALSRAERPQLVVRKLIEHFRSFSPSEELPRATDPGALYREIALSKKGVCRHRAYAFTVTALALGIPTRFIRNEAHAWVEIHDATSWHRVDLGGAAGEMQLASNSDVAHVPPSDPFEWPEGSESAEDMTDAALRSGGAGGTARRSPDAIPVPSGSSSLSTNPAPSLVPGPAVSSTVPATPTAASTLGRHQAPDWADVDVGAHEEVVMQGGRVHLAGRVSRGNVPCALTRVDVVLKAGDRTVPIGSLVTDYQGDYAGAITLPFSVPVGDYDLSVVPQNTDCQW